MNSEWLPRGHSPDPIDAEPGETDAVGFGWTVYVKRRFRMVLEVASFWSAIALPALYLPLLIVGIESTDGLMVFLGLYGLHVLSLLGGRRHYDNHE